MKVLIVSTYDKGGAGLAAIRLHNSLLENKVESNILFLKKDQYLKTEQ